jgi:hypothetical protein
MTLGRPRLSIPGTVKDKKEEKADIKSPEHFLLNTASETESEFEITDNEKDADMQTEQADDKADKADKAEVRDTQGGVTYAVVESFSTMLNGDLIVIAEGTKINPSDYHADTLQELIDNGSIRVFS